MAETDGIIPPAGPEAEPVNPEESSATDKEVVKEEDEQKTEEQEQEGIEEKERVVPSERKDREGEGIPPSETPTETDAPMEAPFKEESYNVGDLKESEKKALNALRLKVEEAIRSKTILERKSKSKKEAVAIVDTSTEGKKIEEIAKVEEVGSREAAPPATEELETASKDGGVGEVTTEEEVVSESVEEPAAVDPKEKVSEEKETENIGESGSEEKVTENIGESGSEKKVPENIGASGSEEKVPENIGESGSEEKVPENIGESGSEETTVREVVLEESVPPAPENFFLWDIPIHDGDERTDVILLKFLRARDYNVNDAFNMLKSTISWRKDFAADNLVNEDLGSDFDSLAYMYGSDREGRPVCYNQYAAFQDKNTYQKALGDESKFNKFLRWRIQVLEKGVEKLEFTPGGVNFMVQVIDLKNSPGLVKRRQISKQVVSLLQDNYPELVAKQIIVNAPWYFPGVYAVFGRLFTPRQVHKVVLSTPEKTTQTLFKYISPEQVPILYGGLGRPGDTEFEGLDAPTTKISIKPGEKRAIELPVTDDSGGTLVWDVSVIGWDVVYGEEFNPSAENDYTIIIRKAKKVSAATEAIRNSYKPSQAGKVVLTIDNSVSRTKKIAVYRSAVKKTIPAIDS